MLLKLSFLVCIISFTAAQAMYEDPILYGDRSKSGSICAPKRK